MRALLIAGGTPPSAELLRSYAETAFVCCADSGAAACLAAEISPDVVLGDMDSIEAGQLRSCREAGAEIVRLETAKNDTDTEAALHWVLDRGYDDIVLLGGTGGRIDHLLANIQLVAEARAQGARLRIEDDTHCIRLLEKQDSIEGEPGQTFSIIPFGGDARAHAVEGVAYPLDHLALPLRQAGRGISNVLSATWAPIVVEEGEALLVALKDGGHGA